MPIRRPAKNNEVRIIAGRFRHRLIEFPDHPGLRPTTDRVRETVFNWLMPYVEGAVCLDLFAGSGALGFEALSRGAKKVVFADCDLKVLKQIQANALKLQLSTEEYQLERMMVPESTWCHPPFDLVFLDPPFQHHLLVESFNWLRHHCLIDNHSLIYFEWEKSLGRIALPEGWEFVKEKQAGQVGFGLIRSVQR